MPLRSSRRSNWQSDRGGTPGKLPPESRPPAGPEMVREAPPLLAARVLAVVLTGRQPWLRPAPVSGRGLTTNTVSMMHEFLPAQGIRA